jgi:type IV secretory pathway VirD2 relaxase
MADKVLAETSEVEAERWTRYDKMLQTEQREQGIIDLRPGEGATYLVRENRGLDDRPVKHLERYGLANEVERGRWGVSDRAEDSLTELSERNDVIKTVIRRALARWANVWVEKLEMQ